jgi:hypothetical protein
MGLQYIAAVAVNTAAICPVTRKTLNMQLYRFAPTAQNCSIIIDFSPAAEEQRTPR